MTGSDWLSQHTCVTKLSWLRRATPSGESLVHQFNLVFGLISNQFRILYTGPTLADRWWRKGRMSALILTNRNRPEADQLYETSLKLNHGSDFSNKRHLASVVHCHTVLVSTSSLKKWKAICCLLTYSRCVWLGIGVKVQEDLSGCQNVEKCLNFTKMSSHFRMSPQSSAESEST